MAAKQATLFCGCGRPHIHARGRCARCYSEWLRFGGLRPQALARDGCCLSCGKPEGLIVHHRIPGQNALARLATLCRRCHVRVHRVHRLAYGLPAFWRALWREQHRRQATQLELPLCVPGAPEAAAEQACEQLGLLTRRASSNQVVT
jgi:hypothetical protein